MFEVSAVPFWGQKTQIPSSLPPNGTAVLKGAQRKVAQVWGHGKVL